MNRQEIIRMANAECKRQAEGFQLTFKVPTNDLAALNAIAERTGTTTPPAIIRALIRAFIAKNDE